MFNIKNKINGSGCKHRKGVAKRVASQSGISKKLSKNQEEILHLLTVEYMTPKQIAYRRQTSTQSIYKTMGKLRKKGLISGSIYKGLNNVNALPSKRFNIRLHSQEFNIRLIYKNSHYNKVMKRTNRINLEDNTIRLYNNSIEVYSGKSFIAESVQEATSMSESYFTKFFKKIEDHLKIMIVKSRKQNIKQVKAHYSEMGNELAGDCNKKKVKMKVKASEDGKLCFIIDDSFNLNEFEAIHPITSKRDMEKVIVPFFNDLRDHPVLLSDIMKVLKEAADVNKETACGLNAFTAILTKDTPKEEADPDQKKIPSYIN